MAREDLNTPEGSLQAGRPPAWILAAVALAAVLVYLNTLPNGFVFDDIPIVLENPNVRGLSRTPAIFSSGYGAGTQLGFTALYRPLVTLSLAANYQAGGLSPWHYHLFNTLLHGANALLVVLLAYRLSRSCFVAGAAGLIFALHPVNTEAVAPVVGRTDLLGTVFILGALLLYAKCIRADRLRPLPLAGSLACLAGGLLSKEHAVTVVGLIMLWDLAARDRGLREFLRNLPRRLLFPYSLFIGVVAAYLCVRYGVVGRIGVGGTISVLDNPLVALGQPARFFTAGKVVLVYVSRLVAPVTLAHDYSYPQILPATAAESAAAVFILTVLAWALVYSYRKNRLVFYGIAFFGIGFSIVSNLAFLIGTIMAERLLYFPGIGFCIAAAVLVESGRKRLATRKGAKFATACAAALLGAVCVLFGLRTVLRNSDWRSQLTLYEQAVRVVPNNAKVRMGYGQTLSEHKRPDRALEEFDRALALLEPNTELWFSNVAADIRFDMGNIYKKQGRLDNAVAAYDDALRLRSDHPVFLFNRGQALYAAGRFAEARDSYEKYIAKDPAYHEAFNALALAHEALGEYRRAEKNYIRAIELAPDSAKAHRNLALLYVNKLREGEKAIPHIGRTLELDPDQPDADRFREALRLYHEQKRGER